MDTLCAFWIRIIGRDGLYIYLAPSAAFMTAGGLNSATGYANLRPGVKRSAERAKEIYFVQEKCVIHKYWCNLEQ